MFARNDLFVLSVGDLTVCGDLSGNVCILESVDERKEGLRLVPTRQPEVSIAQSPSKRAAPVHSPAASIPAAGTTERGRSREVREVRGKSGGKKGEGAKKGSGLRKDTADKPPPNPIRMLFQEGGLSFLFSDLDFGLMLKGALGIILAVILSAILLFVAFPDQAATK